MILRLAAISALAVVLAGCDDYGVPDLSGASEPIQVEGGQLIPGPLPSGNGPNVDTIDSLDDEIVAGASGKSFSGDVDQGATSVLIAFADLGTGYWSVPVGPPDPVTPPDLTWSAVCDFSWSLAPGDHELLFAAMNAAGVAGPSQSLTILVDSPVPTGAVVVSLTWDSNADLDLHLLAPDGVELDPQHPSTADMLEPDGGLPPGTGVLDRDSNGGCVEDGFREEDVVFATWPAPGTYAVRVDMFSSCGAPSADFVVTVRANGVVKGRFDGQLLAVQADGGGPGTFITDLTF